MVSIECMLEGSAQIPTIDQAVVIEMQVESSQQNDIVIISAHAALE